MIHSVGEYEKRQTFKRGDVFLCDTSFIIKSISASLPNSKKDVLDANKLKTTLIQKDCTLVYNSIVKNELLHFLRTILMSEFLIANESSLNKNVRYNITGSLTGSVTNVSNWYDAINNLHKNGYGIIFQEALGDKATRLQELFDSFTTGFIYWSASKLKLRSNQNGLEWRNAKILMSHYGLDSSDALIANFAISSIDFKGIISCDNDLRYLKSHDDLNSFDIVVPSPLTAIEQTWRQ